MQCYVPALPSKIGTHFIHFFSFESAFDALVIGDHEINDRIIHLEHVWYFREMESSHYKEKIVKEIDDRLNDDCILMIMQRLSVIELLQMSRLSHRFFSLAKYRRKVEIVPSVIEQPIGMMTLRYLLHVLGNSLTSLVISIDSIHTEAFNCHGEFLKCAVIYCIQEYTGPQLKNLSLQKFGMEKYTHLIPYLLSKLRLRGVDLTLS